MLIGIFMGGVLQQLWGTIRAMQTIVLLILIAVPFPSFSNTFFVACMHIANIDMLDGKDLFQKMFTFKETKPLNEQFENADIDNKNFFL